MLTSIFRKLRCPRSLIFVAHAAKKFEYNIYVTHDVSRSTNECTHTDNTHLISFTILYIFTFYQNHGKAEPVLKINASFLLYSVLNFVSPEGLCLNKYDAFVNAQTILDAALL